MQCSLSAAAVITSGAAAAVAGSTEKSPAPRPGGPSCGAREQLHRARSLQRGVLCCFHHHCYCRRGSRSVLSPDRILSIRTRCPALPTIPQHGAPAHGSMGEPSGAPRRPAAHLSDLPLLLSRTSEQDVMRVAAQHLVHAVPSLQYVRWGACPTPGRARPPPARAHAARCRPLPSTPARSHPQDQPGVGCAQAHRRLGSVPEPTHPGQHGAAAAGLLQDVPADGHATEADGVDGTAQVAGAVRPPCRTPGLLCGLRWRLLCGLLCGHPHSCVLAPPCLHARPPRLPSSRSPACSPELFDDWHLLVNTHGMRGAAAVPLCVASKVYGVILFASEDPLCITKE
jgi:hypothetical protein